METVANLKIGVNRRYITQHDPNSLNSVEPLYFKLIGLRKSLGVRFWELGKTASLAARQRED